MNFDERTLNYFTTFVSDIVYKILAKVQFCRVMSATIISSQTTTMTIRFAGDSTNIPEVRFVNGLSLSASDTVNVLIYNNSGKSSSYLILEKV